MNDRMEGHPAVAAGGRFDATMLTPFGGIFGSVGAFILMTTRLLHIEHIRCVSASSRPRPRDVSRRCGA